MKNVSVKGQKYHTFILHGQVLIKLHYVLCNQVKCNFESDLVYLFYVFNLMLTSQLSRYIYLPFPHFLTLSWLSSQFDVLFKHEKRNKYVPLCLSFHLRLFIFYILYIICLKKGKKKLFNICNYLRILITFVQFKKCGKTHGGVLPLIS